MGLAAARMTDPAAHGGMIIMGSPKVFIGGMPAARVGDPIVCPGFTGPVPHIMGNITMGSTTVMIDGAYAARQTDQTGCGVAGVSGANMPAVSGPPTPAAPAPPGIPGAYTPEQGAVYGDGNVGFLWGQHTGHSNIDGGQEAGRISAEHIEGTTTVGNVTFSGSVDGVTAAGEVHGGIGSLGASADGSVVRVQGSATSTSGDRVGVQGGLFNAGIGGDMLVGTDGRRSGIAFGASFQASVAEGQIDRTEVYPIPFTDYSINVGSTVGGSLGSAGGAGQVGAYHDAADDRLHLMGMIDLELVAGAKLGLDFSFGHRAAPPPAPPPVGIPGIGIPMTPGTVIMGFPTVLIG